MTLRAYRTFRRALAKGRIYNSDATMFLSALKSDSADIVFLDPPFNLNKDYGSDTARDRRPEDQYEAWLQEHILHSIRILRPGGALYIYHLPKWAMILGNSLQQEMEFRHWVAISMKNGFARGKRLYPAHYALLYFTKGAPATFNRPKLPVTLCRHCQKPTKDYGGYSRIVEENGLNLSDFWEDLSPVRHRTTKHRIQNELPRRMLSRIVAISGLAGGCYVDPFAGSGVGALEAAKAGMTFLVNDMSRSSCDVIVERLSRHSTERHREHTN